MEHRKYIQESLDYIEDNLKTELTAAELAQRAGFSVYHYYRLFQTATGLPVMQYILRRRLLHAIFEIGRGRTRIDAVLEYGFDTYSGFYKAFQREFGCTPTQWLREKPVRYPYRINLYQEEPIMVTHKKAAQILRHWNLSHLRVADAPRGNAFSVGENLVLKYTANPGRLENHLALSRALENVGIACARPIPACTGELLIRDGELTFVLTERLSGEPLSAEALFRGDAAANARFVGEIIGQLHTVLRSAEAVVNDADLSATVRTWALPKTREALQLPEDFCRSFLDTFTDLYPRLPRQIIHRDPNPGNILVGGGTWGFLDFELSERNVRIYDPCYAATAVLSETFGRCSGEEWLTLLRNILLGYDSVVTLTEEEWAAVPYVILANQMVCVAWFAEQNKYEELFEINKPMTLWLMEHFHQLGTE